MNDDEKTWRQRLLSWIDNQQNILKLFAAGAVLFFIGVALIVYADRAMPPSLKQEIMALLGLGIGGLGFTTAMTGQVLLILSRFKNLGG